MTNAVSRRGFLTGERGTPRPAPAPLPVPPWASASFDQRCDGCGKCSTACPFGLIAQNDQRRPVMQFGKGGCDFCGDCARACPTGALSPDAARSGAATAGWTHKAVVSAACLSLQGVTCRVCTEYCPPRALTMPLMAGGRSYPVLRESSCTGCGGCVAPCPVQAVSVISPPCPEC